MPADTSEIEQHLKRHYLFGNLDDSVLHGLAQRVRRLELDAGEILFHQEDPAERFFLVADGQIKLFRLSPAGQEKVIEIMSPGHTFAEAVMFMQKRAYPVSAQALSQAVIFSIPSRVYLDILKGSTESCLRLLGDLSVRLHGRLQELDHLAQQNASHRLVRYLLNQLPPEAGARAEIELNVPKQVLASKLSIKPESFSRLLSALSQAGIIEVQGRRITVYDVERLKNYE